MSHWEVWCEWTIEEYGQALRILDLHARDQAILQAFLDTPDHTLDTYSLARQAQLSGRRLSIVRLEGVASKFGQILNPDSFLRGMDPQWWRYIATANRPDNLLRWTLHPELIWALLAAGWTPAALAGHPKL